jgi:bile acid-coenzyme A ligase
MLVSGLLDMHTVVVQGTFSPEKTVRSIEDQAVRWMQLTPAHMRRMLSSPEVTAVRLASLRGVLHTAASCDAWTKQGWNDLLGPERVFEMYGATERIGMTLATGAEWAARPGTVGKGFLTQIRIVGEDGATLPVGVEGRVFMRHGAGHRGRRALTTAGEEYTPDGFRSVGDRGRLDADGYLYLGDRRTDMFTVGGANVYPAEVERVIMALPGVQDVAVIGHRDEALGSVPVAYVLPTAVERLTVDEVVRHCRAALAVHKRPREVRLVADLPRTEAGKLHRRRLAETTDIPDTSEEPQP